MNREPNRRFSKEELGSTRLLLLLLLRRVRRELIVDDHDHIKNAVDSLDHGGGVDGYTLGR
jgi:hypothetical protein